MDTIEPDNEDLLITKTAIDLSQPDIEIVDSAESEKKLSFLQGLGIVIGLQIGSGIFSSPNTIHRLAGSYGASLGVWIGGGLLAWSGASCYCELGSAIPTSGGTSSYLKRIYSDYASFVYSWTALSVLKPGSAAIIALVLGEYITPHAIYKRICAISVLLVTSVINYFEHGASAGVHFLILKFVLLLFVFIISIIVGSNRDLSGDSIWGGTKSVGEIIAALYGGLWAYDGWDNLNFLTGEMKNPKRDLPRVILTAMPTVILIYCVINCGYFFALSSDALDSATSVALTLARYTNSTALVIAVRIGIALSCAGALNATTMSFVKLIRIVADEKYLPRVCSRPGGAIIFQFILTSAYICAGEFHSLVLFYGAAGYIFYLVSVIGMLILRYKEPELPRPYKTWLIAPIVFICLSMTLIGRTAFSHPVILLLVLSFIFAGSPWYIYCTKYR